MSSQPGDRAFAAAAPPGGHEAEIVICMGSSCFSRGNRGTLEFIEKYLADRGLTDKVKELKGSRCEDRCPRRPERRRHDLRPADPGRTEGRPRPPVPDHDPNARRYPVYTEEAECQDCYKCLRRGQGHP